MTEFGGRTTVGRTNGDDSRSSNQNTSCIDAMNRIANNAVICASNNNPRIMCTRLCRGYYEDIIDNCPMVCCVYTYLIKVAHEFRHYHYLITTYYTKAVYIYNEEVAIISYIAICCNMHIQLPY